MVGYRYIILWAVCSKIGQEVFTRYKVGKVSAGESIL